MARISRNTAILMKSLGLLPRDLDFDGFELTPYVGIAIPATDLLNQIFLPGGGSTAIGAPGANQDLVAITIPSDGLYDIYSSLEISAPAGGLAALRRVTLLRIQNEGLGAAIFNEDVFMQAVGPAAAARLPPLRLTLRKGWVVACRTVDAFVGGEQILANFNVIQRMSD